MVFCGKNYASPLLAYVIVLVLTSTPLFALPCEWFYFIILLFYYCFVLLFCYLCFRHEPL